MTYSDHVCTEDGAWEGNCHHGRIVVRRGEHFPECPGCRRGIDWHRVGPIPEATHRDVRSACWDWAGDGWWPGKDAT